MAIVKKPKKEAPALLNLDKDVLVEKPKWVWYPYIPANSATLLFGVGGIGKSYISCEIAAALSAGRPLPGQTKAETKKYRVLMMSAEDSPSVVIKPRLMLCGADLKRVFVPAEPFTLDEWGLTTVSKYMEDCGASVVIIDPIVHYLGGKIDMNKMNEVRAITGELQQKAMKSESALLIIHHARKGSEGMGFERAAGSADFINAVRSACFASYAEDGTAVFSHVKTNYGVFGPGLAYYIDEDGFHWIGEYDDDNVLRPKTSGKLDEARSFLKVALEHGPVRSTELIQMAREEGIPRATLNRAKTGVAESIVRFAGNERQWYWRLEGDTNEPSGVTLHAEDPDD